MIKSISYWSFPGGLEGSRPVAEVFAHAKKSCFEGVEVCMGATGDVSLETTEATAKKVLELARENGIVIPSVATGLFWDTSLTSSDAKVRGKALDIGKKLIDVASWLEAEVVLVVPGAVDVCWMPEVEVREYSEVYDLATQAVGELEKHARGANVAIGIENVWNKFLLSPVEMRDFIDQFGSDFVGSYFDVGNCLLYAYPEHWIRTLGKRIKRVHLKDFRRSVGTPGGFVDLLAGDVNWPEVMKALGEIGYDNALTAEMIPSYLHYPEVLIDNTSRAMDAIMGRKPCCCR